MKSIAILIPIFNRLEITKQGLNSLYKSLEYYKINGRGENQHYGIIIDDGSTDGSTEWISANYKEIYLLKGDGNLWWTGSINKGADYAITILNSDYILLWNDDVHPNLDYFVVIENLIKDECYENTIIGSKVVSINEPDKIWSAGGVFDRFSGNFGMKTKISEFTENIVRCDWLPGMGTLIPVARIKSLGLKWDDKHFPHYHGDSDFTLRCNSSGIKIITYLALIIWNNTETSGFRKKKSIKDLRTSFTSLKSGYNIKVDFRFYARHGYFPFAFAGMFMKYFYYLGGYVKHSLLKL